MDALTANDLSLYAAPNGSLMFPDMTPRSGMIAGVPVLVSPAITERRIYGIDAASVALNVVNIALDQSNAAAIQMDSAPTQASLNPTATTAVSMWQTNSTAIRAVLTFGLERLRNTAVAIVENTGAYAPVTT
jgi:hypothetical protein